MPGAKVGFMTRFGELWREHPLLMTTGLLAVLLVGGVVVPPLVHALFPALQSATGGDEPPIRVKGGSIDLDLIDADTSSSPWSGASKDYTPARGRRKSDNLGFAVLNPTNGCPATGSNVQKLVFRYAASGGPDDVTIQSTGNTTHVKGNVDFATPSGRTLTYPGSGNGTWYMKIHLNGGGTPVTCTLGANNEVLVFEW